MIAIDTSAWVEYLRDTRSPVCERVDGAVRDGQFATCDAVAMEVLAGAHSEGHLLELRGLLARGAVTPVERTDFDEAAEIYRICRRSGSTIRRQIDCLIAANAIRTGLPVLHGDADFTSMELHTALCCVDV